MKGFKKDGKFRPTGKKPSSSLKKSDLSKTRYKDSLANATVLPNQVLKLMKDGFDFSVIKDKSESPDRFEVAIFDDRLTTPRTELGLAPNKYSTWLTQDEVDELQMKFNNDPEGFYHSWKSEYSSST